MSTKRRVVLQSNQNIIVEFTNERIIPAGGLAVVGALLGKSDFIKKMNRMDVTPNRSQHQIKNGDILLTYLGMLCIGELFWLFTAEVTEISFDRSLWLILSVLLETVQAFFHMSDSQMEEFVAGFMSRLPEQIRESLQTNLLGNIAA